MSPKTKNSDRVIVMHPPVSGEAGAIADVIQDSDVTTVVLGDPAAASLPLPSPTADAIPRQAKPKIERAWALDAYRGLFLLMMTFAMTIPHREGLFPEWMYHMQTPPFADFVERAGLTWRDLLFPGFLFTMCTAIPITNALRLSKGMPYPAVIWTAVKRFAVLYCFALIIGHALPYWTQDYTKRGNIIAIIAFLVCWPMFMRKPESWKQETFDQVKKLGWALGAAVIFALPLVYGSEFSLQRKDGVIHALAFVSLFTTCLWLFTRTSAAIRLGVLGIVLALTAASDAGLAGGSLLTSIEKPWFFQAWMVELLVIGIPATIIGDQLLKWMRAQDDEARVTWPGWRLAALTALALASVATGVVAFYLREVTAATVALGALAALSLAVSFQARTEREQVLSTIVRWAAAMMVAGALLEPLGGGMKKDPQTLSYLLFTAGTSMAILVAVMVAADVLKLARRATRFLVDIGQNPLLAYIAFTMFFNNIAWLVIFPHWQPSTAGQALLVSACFTAAVGALVAITSRKGIYWRA